MAKRKTQFGNHGDYPLSSDSDSSDFGRRQAEREDEEYNPLDSDDEEVFSFDIDSSSSKKRASLRRNSSSERSISISRADSGREGLRKRDHNRVVIVSEDEEEKEIRAGDAKTMIGELPDHEPTREQTQETPNPTQALREGKELLQDRTETINLASSLVSESSTSEQPDNREKRVRKSDSFVEETTMDGKSEPTPSPSRQDAGVEKLHDGSPSPEDSLLIEVRKPSRSTPVTEFGSILLFDKMLEDASHVSTYRCECQLVGHNQTVSLQSLYEEAPRIVGGASLEAENLFVSGLLVVPKGEEKMVENCGENCLILVCLDGEKDATDVTINGNSFLLNKSDVCWVPKGNEYSIRNRSEQVDARFVFINIRSDFLCVCSSYVFYLLFANTCWSFTENGNLFHGSSSH